MSFLDCDDPIAKEFNQILNGINNFRSITHCLFDDQMILVLPLDRETKYNKHSLYWSIKSRFKRIRYSRNDNIFVILTERMDKTDILNLYPYERKEYRLTDLI